jgi:hypothetical protein
MERCPNCDTPGRPGAKFCTTCGFRFPGDASDSEPAESDMDATASANDDPGLFPGAMTDGWPSPSPAETDPGGWNEPAAPPQAAPAEPGEGAEVATTSSTWAASTVDSWPMRPAVPGDEPPPSEPESRPSENVEAGSVDLQEGATGNQTGSGEAVVRATLLLDELRQTISEIGLQANSAVDLSGVVSDLQVAVSPPGAMAVDDVAELRDALLAARERPRDIDTIVDLTKRIDAMLALVIAYDRAIAAIERSLETLRGDGVVG